MGRHGEVVVQLLGIRWCQTIGLDHTVDGAAHVPQPCVTLGRSDDERNVPHTQAGVTS